MTDAEKIAELEERLNLQADLLDKFLNDLTDLKFMVAKSNTCHSKTVGRFSMLELSFKSLESRLAALEKQVAPHDCDTKPAVDHESENVSSDRWLLKGGPCASQEFCDEFGIQDAAATVDDHNGPLVAEVKLCRCPNPRLSDPIPIRQVGTDTVGLLCHRCLGLHVAARNSSGLAEQEQKQANEKIDCAIDRDMKTIYQEPPR